MSAPFLFICLSLVLCSSFSSSALYMLRKGSSLSVEESGDVLISVNGEFSAGFYPIGDNAYCFAIWFTQALSDGSRTVVWMANRDQPANGRDSKLYLLKTGNLVLADAGRLTLWATDTTSDSSVQLHLHNTGNLVLHTLEGKILWQSFDSPTDTLLPYQLFNKNTILVSSRNRNSYSSGFYKFYFDDDNVLRLRFDGREASSIYWPKPWLRPAESGRSAHNNSRTAMLDSYGLFKSSDDFRFSSTDLGKGPKRRLTIDADGNVRLYSLDERRRAWNVTWQAVSTTCFIHGTCGANSLCTYNLITGRRCNCLPGHKMRNRTDWSYGCEPEFDLSCNNDGYDFVKFPHVEFYGYDIEYYTNKTLEDCEKRCLQHCDCKGVQYKFSREGYYLCYIKNRLLNGYRSPGYINPMYVKVPRANISNYNKTFQELRLDCSDQVTMQLERTYTKKHENGTVKFMLWFACGCGGLEIIGFLFVLYVLYRNHEGSGTIKNGYAHITIGFKRFTYAELKKASRNFSMEIGRGGSGVVYKGVLSDNRVAAIKRLIIEANQGEAEFLAEVSTIGRLNHMNLIETWGSCAEGKHRLLVYEFMKHGSLAENLTSNSLDWKTRFEIALGTAKGLAYLHEECLEWVLHCDVKPQNILLDSNYHPKLADFGLSKLLNRGAIGNSSFSRIRGTRGYMAPEWVFNLPITSKVDVYSYGIVMLEMATGRSPVGVQTMDDNGVMEQRRLVTWVREKMENESWIEEILDETMDGEYDKDQIEILVRVAMHCADQEDKDARPTMSNVLELLLGHGNDGF